MYVRVAMCMSVYANIYYQQFANTSELKLYISLTLNVSKIVGQLWRWTHCRIQEAITSQPIRLERPEWRSNIGACSVNPTWRENSSKRWDIFGPISLPSDPKLTKRWSDVVYHCAHVVICRSVRGHSVMRGQGRREDAKWDLDKFQGRSR